MKSCSCDQYEKDCFIPINLKDLAEDFELIELSSGPSHAEGWAKCKNCTQEFNWQYEAFVHEKIMISKKIN